MRGPKASKTFLKSSSENSLGRFFTKRLLKMSSAPSGTLSDLDKKTCAETVKDWPSSREIYLPFICRGKWVIKKRYLRISKPPRQLRELWTEWSRSLSTRSCPWCWHGRRESDRTERNYRADPCGTSDYRNPLQKCWTSGHNSSRGPCRRVVRDKLYRAAQGTWYQSRASSPA